MTGWTGPEHLREALRKKWVNGSLARAYAAGDAFVPVSVRIQGPSAAETAERLEAVRRWVASLERASRDGNVFRLETKRVGSAALGYTTLPARAHVERFEQVWSMLGVEAEVRTLDETLRSSAAHPGVLDWVKAHPLTAIAHADRWPRLIDAVDWLEWNRDTGKHLREIDVVGLDTKFIEDHRGVLAGMLGVSASAHGFVRDLGLARKPATIRMRIDPTVFGMPAAITEAVFRVDEVRALPARVERVLIVENEVTYLTVPVPVGSVVIWGKGYDVAQAAALTWLADAKQWYWGDIDTHGLQILHRARAHLPRMRSVLMDTPTLLASRDQWGTEPKPTNAALSHLTAEETALYSDLVTDRYGPRVRLEQERIRWDWVLARLTDAGFLDS